MLGSDNRVLSGATFTAEAGSTVDLDAATVTLPPSADNQIANEVPFTPAGTIAASDVQAAIEEVASEAGGGAVDSVNSLTGVVVLDPDDLSDAATTNKFTDAAAISKLAGIEAGAKDDQTGVEVSFSDPDSNYIATTIEGALAELFSVNGTGPNSATGKLDWSEIVNMPAGFADGSDDGAGGSAGTVNTIKEATAQVGGSDIVTLDFGVGFDLVESPDTEIQVDLDLTEVAAGVKTAYESNADTNEFSDAEQTLLGNQSGTNTGDQTAAQISVVTSAFAGNFVNNASHDTVQELMDVVDDLALGGSPATADISDVSVTQTELAELETIGATVIEAADWIAVAALVGVNTGNQTNFADFSGVITDPSLILTAAPMGGTLVLNVTELWNTKTFTVATATLTLSATPGVGQEFGAEFTNNLAVSGDITITLPAGNWYDEAYNGLRTAFIIPADGKVSFSVIYDGTNYTIGGLPIDAFTDITSDQTPNDTATDIFVYHDGTTKQTKSATLQLITSQSYAVADLNDTATPSFLTTAETSSGIFSNYKSAGADHVFTMPAAHTFGQAIFSIGDEFQVDIEPVSADLFYLNGTAMAVDEHIQNTADTLGERIVGYCVNINGTLRWMFYSSDTAWVEATP